MKDGSYLKSRRQVSTAFRSVSVAEQVPRDHVTEHGAARDRARSRTEAQC